MRSRAVRLTLTLLALAAVAAGGYVAWMIESGEVQRRAAATAFESQRVTALRDAYELRAAQQAYVAAGQSESFWFDKVTALSESLRASIGILDSSAPSVARSWIADSTSQLRAFEGVDRRARNYAATGQKLLASDIIFGDGLGAVTALIAALEQAGVHSAAAAADAARAARREQLTSVAAGIGALLFVLLLLTPAPAPRVTMAAEAVGASRAPTAPAVLDLKLRDDSPPARRPAAPVAETPKRPERRQTSAPAMVPAVDIQAVAAVCTDLAKLGDTDTLPGILERTARALDARGLVLWVADYEGTELVPVATYGYPASVLSRLGTIRRDAENATGAAFRTGLVQTVAATASSSGAIAAPLVTPSGCRGVMSAEVQGGGEVQSAKLAVAAIVAAQLAGLVGPPPAAAAPEREAAL